MPIGDVGLYTLLMEKQAETGDDTPWYNKYVLYTETAFSADNFSANAEDFALFEQALHLPGVIITRALLSTYNADSNPYNPLNLAIYEFGYEGTRGGTSDPLDRDCIAYVRKQVLAGRQGKLFYRGCLREGDVNATPGSRWGAWSTSDAFPTTLNTALGNISGYMGSIPAGSDFNLVLVNAVGVPPSDIIRPVISLDAIRPGLNRSDHGWFNRS